MKSNQRFLCRRCRSHVNQKRYVCHTVLSSTEELPRPPPLSCSHTTVVRQIHAQRRTDSAAGPDRWRRGRAGAAWDERSNINPFPSLAHRKAGAGTDRNPRFGGITVVSGNKWMMTRKARKGEGFVCLGGVELPNSRRRRASLRKLRLRYACTKEDRKEIQWPNTAMNSQPSHPASLTCFPAPARPLSLSALPSHQQSDIKRINPITAFLSHKSAPSPRCRLPRPPARPGRRSRRPRQDGEQIDRSFVRSLVCGKFRAV